MAALPLFYSSSRACIFPQVFDFTTVHVSIRSFGHSNMVTVHVSIRRFAICNKLIESNYLYPSAAISAEYLGLEHVSARSQYDISCILHPSRLSKPVEG